ncbi:MAG: TIGR03663 family protein [Verrucomicrobia bacterium]|nr:TIGR03663 family protein [Verrucomicrobiota bacterium]
MPRETPRLMKWRLMLLLLILAGSLGWLYRSSELAKRPMHTDEAILGIKTIELLKTGRFQYDPHDYHGPLLHYSTKWIGSLLGWSPDTINEEQLRLATAIYGLALILIPLLLGDVLTRTGAVFAALFIAVSPMMCFYSRYYIMETPLVFFCGLFIASLWRWSQSQNKLWLLIAGVSLGAMHTAKETFVLNIAAMAVAYVVAGFIGGGFTSSHTGYSFSDTRRASGRTLCWIMVPLIGILTSVAFYSNGFQDWSQVRDSILTYQSYWQRSGGAGHEKPWHYYLTLLFWNPNALKTWTEALMGVLAVIGFISALLDLNRPSHHRTFLVFLGVYVFGLLAIYSAIPYKTPWAVLAVDHAFALLAGAGAAALFRMSKLYMFKFAFGVALMAGIYNLCQQTSLAIDFNKEPLARYSAHELNPYVYSHTTNRVLVLSKFIHDLAALHPEKNDMPVQVIESGYGWPLGWYLRDLKQVGYYKSLPDKMAPTSVILADIALHDEILSRLAPKAAPIIEDDPNFIGPLQPPAPPAPVFIYQTDEACNLRPGVLLTVLVEKNLRETLRKKQAAAR